MSDRIKLLLIEDDEDDYILTCDLLGEIKGTKYEITWISKYTEALDAICLGDYDVCLVDYRLGEGTGIELIRASAVRGSLMPIILLTGQGEKEIDIEAAEAGAADYLAKSYIDAPLLERSIRYAIAHGKMLETMRESEKRFRSIIESANDAIILIDQQGSILSWNKSAQTIFGYSQDEAINRHFSLLVPDRLFKSEEKEISQLFLSGLINGNNAVELSGVRKNGEEFPLEISLSSWQTQEGFFFCGIIRDVTERKALENQLTHQALHDPLTKLANRVLFRNRVEHALARAERVNKPIAVLFLDLDNFKTINDSLGHAAGDQLLVSVSERLHLCLRTSDTAARLGGDEFAVLVEDSEQSDDAVLVAERILDFLRPPFMIDGKEVYVGTSIGIAITETGRENPEDLLRNADVAMYMAKKNGRGCYVIFENTMHSALIKRMELESDLRRSIEKGNFLLNYQPIVDLKTEKLIGMEALVRWRHPKRGIIPPLEFIPIAEETGLIVPLGRWILETACRQANLWKTKFLKDQLFSLTVNLSGGQFEQQNIVETVAAALEKSGLPPECLVLEITENMMLHNTEATIKKLEQLKALGIRLAIDDFGTGYSSLSYLQRFPVDILKIDKSFVDKISSGKEGAAVARAIITMSEALQLRTVAEGIEKQEQTRELQNLGCEFGQGYLFAKPLSNGEMEEFLNRLNLPETISAIQELTISDIPDMAFIVN